LHRRLGAWLEPIRSEAGLHLAARIRSPAAAPSILAKARVHAPGAQSIAEYALLPPARPAIVFGYGVIDASEITASLRRFARALAEVNAQDRLRSIAAAIPSASRTHSTTGQLPKRA
jgi:GntR family transcriptional regulator/MocR family aminotransferase